MPETNGRTPKVFVVNKSSHDFSPAEKFGELVFVTKGRQFYFAVNNHFRSWYEALKDSQPEDFIILTSLNILCAIGCAMFAAKHGRINFLIYRADRTGGEGKYVPRTVVFDPEALEGPNDTDE